MNESPPMNVKRATVFVDRDGTLNPDPGYIASPEKFACFPTVPEAILQLNRAGLIVIMVTNQSGIARGYFSLQNLEDIHRKLQDDLAKSRAWLDDVLFCPHHPDDGCRCRKPNPGMIECAASRHPIDLAASYVVGDQSRDVEMAHGVGAKGILVMTGRESQEALAVCREKRVPVDFVAPCFSDAVSWILRR